MKDKVELTKSMLQIARDLLIAVFVGLVFFAPGFINSRLKAANIKEARWGGLLWENEAFKAGGDISNAKLGVQDVAQALTDVAGKTKDPAVQGALKDAVNRLKVSEASINSADQSIKLSVAQGQASTTQSGSTEQPQKASEGWIFLGHVTQDKRDWTYTNSHKPGGGDPDLTPGQLQTSDTIYLHAPAPPGQHASGSVIGVIPNGTTIQVLEIDTSSHALAGGWFVWARVKAA